MRHALVVLCEADHATYARDGAILCSLLSCALLHDSFTGAMFCVTAVLESSAEQVAARLYSNKKWPVATLKEAMDLLEVGRLHLTSLQYTLRLSGRRRGFWVLESTGVELWRGV